MSKGGLQDWPDAADAGKRAICQTMEGEIIEGRIELAGYEPGEERPTPMFALATVSGEFVDWSELEGWKLV